MGMKARILFFVLFLHYVQPIMAAEPLTVIDRVPELTWVGLASNQRAILAPLEPIWPSFSLNQRREWIGIAARYPSLGAVEQQRLQQRMGEWAHMTPAQRRAARKNFQASRALSAQHKADAWNAYQALPEEHKKALAQTAVKKNKPKTVVSASPPVHPPGQELTHIGKRKQALRRTSANELSAHPPKSPLPASAPPASPPPSPVIGHPPAQEAGHE